MPWLISANHLADKIWKDRVLEAAYWLNKWDRGEIGFHQSDFNHLMVRHFSAFGLDVGAHVFVPLCGKTRDIAWLLQQGFRVTGCELSRDAVEALYADLSLTPMVTQDGGLIRYATPDLVVFVGDIFDVSARALGNVQAVYDRAALVALPAEVRARYANHVAVITDHAPQLIVTFTYDPSKMSGPPFSVTSDMIADLFGRDYDLNLMETCEVASGLKRGLVAATESAWRLMPRAAK